MLSGTLIRSTDNLFVSDKMAAITTSSSSSLSSSSSSSSSKIFSLRSLAAALVAAVGVVLAAAPQTVAAIGELESCDTLAFAGKQAAIAAPAGYTFSGTLKADKKTGFPFYLMTIAAPAPMTTFMVQSFDAVTNELAGTFYAPTAGATPSSCNTTQAAPSNSTMTATAPTANLTFFWGPADETPDARYIFKVAVVADRPPSRNGTVTPIGYLLSTTTLAVGSASTSSGNFAALNAMYEQTYSIAKMAGFVGAGVGAVVVVAAFAGFIMARTNSSSGGGRGGGNGGGGNGGRGGDGGSGGRAEMGMASTNNGPRNIDRIL